MDKYVIADLKQFSAVNFSQQAAVLRDEIRQDVRKEIRESEARLEAKLGQRIDDLSGFIAEVLDTSNNETDKRLDDHEHRITTLETKAA